MATETDGIVVEILANVTGLLTGMKQATVGVEAATAEIEGALEGLEAVATAVLGPFIAIFALVEGAEMFGGAVKSSIDMARELTVLHQKTGIAVEDLSALRYAATRSEVSAETLTISLQRLARAAQSAAEGGAGVAAVAFRAIGVSAVDNAGRLRPMRDLLLDIAQRFEHMPDGTTKAALAMDLFGRSGTNLIPLLNRGRDGIHELEEEARRLGITMSEKDVAAALEYEEAMKKLHAVWGAFIRNIVIAVLPGLEKLVQLLEAMIHAVRSAWFMTLAFGNYLKGDFTAGAARAAEALEEWKKIAESFKEITPAQAAGTGDGPAPIIPTKDDGPSQLEKWREELNGILEDAIKSGMNLEQVELDFWNSKLAIAEKGSKDYIAIHSRIVELEKQISAKHAEEEKKLQEDIARGWMEVFKAIPRAFEDTIRSMRQTGGSFGDFMRGVFKGLVTSFIGGEIQMLEAHAAAWLARKHITAQGVAWEVALEAWGAIKSITMSAYKAAASAYAAIVGIPYVGPFLAPAAAIGSLAAVLALVGGISSAAGGFDVPQGLNPVTQLHQNEMVLPAKYADVIRGMADGGGGGGEGMNLHIYAMDSADVARWAERNKHVIGKAAMSYVGNGGAPRSATGRRG